LGVLTKLQVGRLRNRDLISRHAGNFFLLRSFQTDSETLLAATSFEGLVVMPFNYSIFSVLALHLFNSDLSTMYLLFLTISCRICSRNLRTFFLFCPLKNRGA
jgi:hypothetical protein